MYALYRNESLPADFSIDDARLSIDPGASYEAGTWTEDGTFLFYDDFDGGAMGQGWNTDVDEKDNWSLTPHPERLEFLGGSTNRKMPANR